LYDIFIGIIGAIIVGRFEGILVFIFKLDDDDNGILLDGTITEVFVENPPFVIAAVVEEDDDDDDAFFMAEFVLI
jgi:hypothetical protein